MNHQEQIQQAVDIATSSPATVTTVTAGTATVLAGLPMAIQLLTALVLLCQAVAWIYRGWKWLNNKNKKS
jgi:hypothetical protein